MKAEKRTKTTAMLVLAAKKESEKVANTVATFLSEYSNDFQVPISRVEPEKVTNMVGTFLHEDIIGSQFKRVIDYTYQADG